MSLLHGLSSSIYLILDNRCPAYSVPDRSNFISLHLAAEVESLVGKLLAYLTSFIHLTLSFDGWTSKGHNEIYTAHVTTPGRRSFLVDGLVLDGISPSGQNLSTLLSRVSISLLYIYHYKLTPLNTDTDYHSFYGRKVFSCRV